MNEITAFILGYLAKALVGILMGKLVMWVWNNLQDLPRVLHYLEQHGGKSFECLVCSKPRNVDGINQA
jgi:hypothetical protein